MTLFLDKVPVTVSRCQHTDIPFPCVCVCVCVCVCEMVAESPLGPINYSCSFVFTFTGDHCVICCYWFMEDQVTALVPGIQ